MLSTESLSWRSIQVVKSHLAGRLARFTRSTTPETRPQKRQNDVAFFEADLRFVLTATPMLVDFSEHEFSDMDRMTRDLLTSLNDMVNEDVISPGALEGTQISPHDMSLLSDKYPRLTSLIAFLDKSTGNFNLTTGTGSFLFILPPGRIGSLAIEQINEFKAFLERLTAKLEKSQDIQMNPQLQKKSSEKVPPHSEHDMHRKRASLMINALFEEFRELGCREMHEVKLRVSHDWQTGNCDNTLDIFLSSCPDPGNWQQAKCGTFQINIDKTLKDGLCDAIQRARQRGIILCLFVDQGGLFDISDKMPPIMSALHGFSSESLGELLDQKAFIRMTPRDYLKGIVTEKFDSREKATLALSLARCLMEFFNEDLELASYSWKPESIYFLRSTAAHGSSRDPYISLRPKFSSASNPDLPVLKTIRPGNPILLSFARLLLEIDSGEKIPITIHAESRANVSTWGEMCDFVNVAGIEGNSNYLKAVEGCLYLHMALSKSESQSTGPAAAEILRKVIYERIVHNLELTLIPQNQKRKRGDSFSECPQEKRKSLISSPLNTDIPTVLPRPLSKKASRPSSRDEFEIAIVCALPREYDAVYFLIDEVWDGDCDYYGGANGDSNMYTAGRMGTFNIVLVLLPQMGKVSAAGASARLQLSYPRIRLVLLTGICGGVPRPGEDEELLLGDVVISRHILRYDFGKQYPDKFHFQDTAESGPGRAPQSIRHLLTIIETTVGRERLEQRAGFFLQEIQKSAALRRRGVKYQYPGSSQDNLFQSSYQHKHHLSSQCACTNSDDDLKTVCEESRQLSCDDLGCDKSYIIQRERLKLKQQLERQGREKDAQVPCILLGRFASGDCVMKSGEDRERIAKRHGVVAFEMEGSGIWDEIPCIIVKAVCDYADSHKNKVWQDFAAATAASTAKALLEQYWRG